MTPSKALDRYFSIELPFSQFCWNVLLFSCLSLLPFLLVFVASSPGFASMLVTNGTAFGRFMRQVLTNGVLVVFVINYLGFFAASVRRQQRGNIPIGYLLIDGFVRAFLFVGLHALIYVVSSDLFASFGGERGTALKVVGPTLERAYLFENISGAYLYGILPGAFVVYLALRQQPIAGTSEHLAGTTRIRDISIAVVVCISVVLTISLLAVAMTRLLGRA